MSLSNRLLQIMSIEDILKLGAAYGILQILAQDLGIKTGKRQRDLIQTMPVQVFIMYSGAYSVTGDHKLAAMITALYYVLKYVYSGGETSDVCFESV